MGLLNYTTQISVEKTIGEIQSALSKGRARAILIDFDGAGNPVSMSFKVTTPHGDVAFRLPADPRPVLTILNQQVREGKIPRRFQNDVDQSRRVSWRIVKDWVIAQLALVETGMVSVEQVFLAYAQDPATGKTVYERLVESKFDQLALPPCVTTWPNPPA
jgi:hypothetical protein